MSTTSHWSVAIRSVLLQPTRGIVGLVDDLLGLCRQHGLEVDWQAGRCCVRSVGGDWHELTDVPLRKSVFRAILARLAVLCNEHRPGSVSPYGGKGEIAVGASPSTVFRVALTNTPAEQRFELMRDAVAELPRSYPFAAHEGPPVLENLLADAPTSEAKRNENT